MPKRDNYISWDEYFMGIAVTSAMRSKDPSTQVGACIANMQNKVVSIGYNGMPNGVSDNEVSWEPGTGLNSKYLYVAHAELNAILNAKDGSALSNTKIYVTLFPCNECAKAIIQSGIKEVIYAEDKYHDELSAQAARKLFSLAGVKTTAYKGRMPKIEYESEKN
jgi:dCMP deaminase